MKVIGEFNKISEDLKKRCIKPLRPGQVVNFRLLDAIDDPSRSIETGDYSIAPEKKFGAGRSIVLRDIILDSDRMVTVGVPRKYTATEVTKVKKLYLAPSGAFICHNGIFSLTGGNIEHIEIYEHLCLRNDNKSNPNRDESVTPKFEMIDEVAEAKVELTKLEFYEKAIVAAASMTPQQIKDFAAGLNWPINEDPTILTARVKKYAKDQPKKFLSRFGDKDIKVKVLLKKAFDLGVINYQPDVNKVVWAGTAGTLALLDKPQEGENHIDSLYKWLQANKAKENILKGLTNQVKNKEEGSPEDDED